jgi:hypothetical protein
MLQRVERPGACRPITSRNCEDSSSSSVKARRSFEHNCEMLRFESDVEELSIRIMQLPRNKLQNG